jgi:hypothetical protein
VAVPQVSVRAASEIAPDPLDWVPTAVPGRPARPATPEEMVDLLAAVAGRPEIGPAAAALAAPAGERRWVALHRDDHLDVWLITWGPGSDTGWHDHDGSGGAFHVVDGTVTERRPRLTGGPECADVAVGTGRTFGPYHLHRMTAATSPAVTLHAYSPPLRRMGQYRPDADGALERRTVGADEELRAPAER